MKKSKAEGDEAEEEMDELHNENEELHQQLEKLEKENGEIKAKLANVSDDSEKLGGLKVRSRKFAHPGAITGSIDVRVTCVPLRE
jgi:uncharacterized coiled-coil DUF342 family protein